MNTNYSGRTTSYSHQFDDWKNKPPSDRKAFRKQLVLDAQWSDCPIEVEEDVRKIWATYELGNDDYIFKYRIGEHVYKNGANEFPVLEQYLREQGAGVGETVWIHWWW